MARPSTKFLRGCPVCGNDTWQRVLYEKWSYPILQCVGCGLGSTNVDAHFRPDELYSEEYFQGGRRDGYVDYVGSEATLRHEFRRAVAHLIRRGVKHGRLLEIGCAYGFFLMEAQAYFQCTGLEISEPAVEFCKLRNLDVHCEILSHEFLKKHGPFDAVVMLDTIEHLIDPAETLALLREGLSERGVVMISTGDWDSLLSRVMGRRWRLMTPPQHLFYFSPRTLGSLLKRKGFEVVDYTYPWKIVPLLLAAYQAGSRLGIPLPIIKKVPPWGVPINLFDAIRLIAQRS